MCFSITEMCLFIQYFLLNNHCCYKHMALLCHWQLTQNVQANLHFMTICLACQHFLSEG